MKLTDKQCRFADAVSSGINPTAAYRDIYNMSDKRPATATEAASRLMKNSNGVARIEAVSEAAEAKIASAASDTASILASTLLFFINRLAASVAVAGRLSLIL